MTEKETPQKVLMSWSSGKDSAWAFHSLRQDPGIEVVGLLTTVNVEFDRVAMHAVRRNLLEQQAAAAQTRLWIVDLPYPCSNTQYEGAMRRVVDRALDAGISAIAFGDLFLRDIREYRKKQLAGTGMSLLFPLWMQDTAELAKLMLASGLKAHVTCVDPKVLDPSFAGREWDATFLGDLPEGIDHCGENGEFHTFVYDGQIFSHPIPIKPGEVVERDGFVFADILPG